eukprot:7006050-Ditylum_brightwellii.AAC.1
MKKQSQQEKDKYPHICCWIFVPFQADGAITETHTMNMVQDQNRYLHDKTTTTITGLKNIDTLSTVPGTNVQKSFHRWMISLKTADNSMYLFNNIEKDSNK